MVKRGFLAGKSTGMILLDVEKAYDSVWQDAVVYKLFRSNLQPFLVKIVESFLTKRSASTFHNLLPDKAEICFRLGIKLLQIGPE
ncbi:hypothetical protein quinque_006137 [Culex quinquefasciatus]